jgi:hypothetical protein
MAVVINDFEVMPAQPRQERGSGEPEKGGGEKSPPAEHEIERLVEHQMSRCERVWAY